MIRSFTHKGLRDFFEQGKMRGLNPQWKNRLERRLEILDAAQSIEDLDIPGWRLHQLKGDRAGYYSIELTANWRLTFRAVEAENASEAGLEKDLDISEVNLEDYH